MPAKLSVLENTRRKAVNSVLAEVRAKQPTQVVIWYSCPGFPGETGVEISEGTERVKAVGALTAMAHDVWRE